jgi:uncharacterized phage protein gp47/JayE
MAVAGQSFSGFVSTMVSAARAAAQSALDTSVGSVSLALLQAVGGTALWLQGLVLQVLAQSRASTSEAADLDSWMADFSFARLPAAAATGQVSFARFQPTAGAVIPIGALVATSVGGQQFAVAADPTNAAYSANAVAAGIPGYVMAPGVAALTVPVAALVPASAGNVIAGAISVMLQPLSGIDTVTNATPLTGGIDPESDAAFRARFPLFLPSRSATKAAIAFALNAIRSGLSFTILEDQNLDGSPHPGFFLVVLDDGSGAPPGSLLAAAGTAIDAARPVGVSFTVVAPQIVPANVTMSLGSVIAANHPADVAAVTNALLGFLDAVPVGTGLSFTRLAQIAYDASGNIGNVTGVQLNGGTGDLPVGIGQVIKAGTVTVI